MPTLEPDEKPAKAAKPKKGYDGPGTYRYTGPDVAQYQGPGVMVSVSPGQVVTLSADPGDLTFERVED